MNGAKVESLNRIKGYLTVRIIGYSPERFLNMCNHHDIRIWNLKNEGNSYVFQMQAGDFKKLGKITKKTHMRIKIEEKFGLPFFLFRFRKRKLFFTGIFCGILLLFFMSMHIWNIEITGNSHESDETLIAYLRENGVYDGMWKKDVRCAEIAAALREDFQDLTWVSVAMDGTCLSIKVKENTDTGTYETDAKEAANAKEHDEDTSGQTPGNGIYSDTGTDITADHSGTVASVITRAGTPMVHKGDQVNQGDILVSGCISIQNDADETIAYRYVHADADIVVRSKESYEEKLPLSYRRKEYTGKKQTGYYLNLFGYSFYLGAKANSYKYSEQTMNEKQVRLSDSFYMPVYYGTKVCREYHFVRDTYTREEAEQILSENFQKYCRNLAQKGVEITENSVKIHVGQNEALISGTLILCRKAEGRRDTEIMKIEEPPETEEQ